MRVLVASDAWEPQINGVVRTLQQVQALAPEFGVCLSVEQSECVALAARYSWRASIRQFCTNLDLARQQDATARAPAGEACQTFPLGL